MSILLTLAVLGTWGLMAVGLAAIGVAFLHRLGGVAPDWRVAYCGIWTGLALLLAALIVWHFFLPANDAALLVFSAVALLALWIERRWFALLLRRPFHWRFAAVCAAFAAWTANHTLAKGVLDDYLYEFQTLRWFHDYPIVPGLANLHGRLGFNNSHHLLAAMLSAGIWRGQVNHIFNGFFVVAACLYLFDAVREIAGGKAGSLERSLFAALLVCPGVGLVMFGTLLGPMIATLKADVLVAVASAILACFFLRWAAAPRGSSGSSTLASATLLLAALLPTVKISAIVFSGFLAVAVVVAEIRQLPREGASRRIFLGALAVAIALAICFPIRGILLSGYPVYPSTALGADVDWRVPAPLVEAERAFVTSHARQRGTQGTYDPAEVSGWQWVPEWARSTVQTDRINLLLPLVLAAICLPILAWPGRANAEARSADGPPGWALAILLCACAATAVFWFLQAPAGRFAIAPFWIFFAAIFSLTVQKQRRRWNWKATLLGLGIALPLAAVFLLSCIKIPAEFRMRAMALLAFAGIWVVAFGLLRVGHPRLLAALCLLPALSQYGERWIGDLLTGQYADLVSMAWFNARQLPTPGPSLLIPSKTRSGLLVYESDFPTFETPLPNTRYFNPDLQLRTARMRDGFRVSSGNGSASTAQTGPGTDSSQGALVPALIDEAARFTARNQNVWAITAFYNALDIASRRGDRRTEAEIDLDLARWYESKKSYDLAMEKYVAADRIFVLLGDRERARTASVSMARVSRHP